MTERVTKGTKEYWGKKASRNLLRTFNCPESTLQIAQEMMSKPDGMLLRASAALAGGVGASGSTCGVVTGGAMTLALMHDDELLGDGAAAEIGLLSIVGDYVDWFKDEYDTTLCRERAGVNFWTLSGFLRYLIPPDRLVGCLSHINGAVQYLHSQQDLDLPAVRGGSAAQGTSPLHCARTVLERVRNRTGVGDPLLERVSIVFDGGVGLRGGACGALVGAIMPISALMWIDLRVASLPQAYGDMLLGLHTLRGRALEKADDPYAAVGRVVTRFQDAADSLECSTITGTSFSDWGTLQKHVQSSDVCARLIELSIDEAVSAVERYRSAA